MIIDSDAMQMSGNRLDNGLTSAIAALADDLNELVRQLEADWEKQRPATEETARQVRLLRERAEILLEGKTVGG